MSRADILAMMEGHEPFDVEELRNKLMGLYLVRTVEGIFRRECNEPGHVCGSALVSNMDGSRVLLNKHGQTGLYINFGGHADGDENVFGVAKRELLEEAGIEGAECSGKLFDIDVHAMHAHVRKGEPVPEHVHVDLTWLFRVPDNVAWVISEESSDIRWFTLEEAMAIHYSSPDKDAQMERLYRKVAAGLR
jgi:8-oxo-dGTP pyrophosphatase MutT (NUDIX family)